jgi:beta-glucosidase
MSGEKQQNELRDSTSAKRLIASSLKTGKPVVLVLFTGRPLVLVQKMKQFQLFFEYLVCRSEAGSAIADVLFEVKIEN